MAQRARIGDPHVRVGLVTGDGGAAIWPLLIGQARAKELLLTGDLLDAEAASRLGLVNHVLAPKALDTAVDAFAARLAQGAQVLTYPDVDGVEPKQARGGRRHRYP